MLGNERFVERVLDGAIKSSDRARWMLLVSVFASVIVFAAAVGIRPKELLNWQAIRVDMLKHQVSTLKADTAPAVVKFDTDVAVNEEHELSRRNQIEIPFFSVRIEINDFGIIGGVALFIIALMLRSTVRTEVDNTRFALSGKGDDLVQRVKILAMHQVLTPIYLLSDGAVPTKSRVSKYLFWHLPVAYAVLVLVDAASAPNMGPYVRECWVIVVAELLILLGLLRITSQVVADICKLDLTWDVALEASGILSPERTSKAADPPNLVSANPT